MLREKYAEEIAGKVLTCIDRRSLFDDDDDDNEDDEFLEIMPFESKIIKIMPFESKLIKIILQTRSRLVRDGW